ncbi:MULTISPECIES: SRPBCC family protein [unclassified Knoellia]|uniref:SRPBCC family protein n=1 Tax=Knoellia altitudinis TaxID=3404795 RepID=UPI003610E06B
MTNDTQITVSRTIDAPAQAIFDVLSNPQRHPDLDGSGFVRSVEQADRIKQVGDVFTMNMTGDHMGGDYQTDNHVTGYDENSLLAWQSTPAGAEPFGWEWVWRLEQQGPGQTLVTHTYDWSKVTDKEILQKVSFPLVSQGQLEDSLARLAEVSAGS